MENKKNKKNSIAWFDDGIAYCEKCAEKREYKDHYNNDLTRYVVTEEERFFFYCDNCGRFI